MRNSALHLALEPWEAWHPSHEMQFLALLVLLWPLAVLSSPITKNSFWPQVHFIDTALQTTCDLTRLNFVFLHPFHEEHDASSGIQQIHSLQKFWITLEMK